jgi:outer membrane lipoprotein-sorting protein
MAQRMGWRFSIFLALVSMNVAGMLHTSPTYANESPEAILQHVRETYAAMQSYADHGVVIKEYSESTRDRHTFTTAFNRAPRHFLFDFHKQGGDRFVIWGDPGAFHTWWKTTDQQTDYPNPNNVNAINLNDFPTSGSATKITILLYPKAPLIGALTHFADPGLDGTEKIGGQECYRIVGRTSDIYGATGKEVALRKVTLWIDTKSLLIRQIREEAKATPGSINRLTTTFEPAANPSLPDTAFQFTPPESQ